MWCLAWWWLWLSLITTLVTSQGPCPTDANIHGFTSITAINNAMMVDLNSIQSGGSPKSSYLFTLCPKTTIVTTVAALTPVLSGAQFVCGAQGALSDACILQGGGANNQVTIANSKVVGYSLHNITFQGITFMASTTQSSILAGAGSGTTAYFINCKWEVRTSRVIVHETLAKTEKARRLFLVRALTHTSPTHIHIYILYVPSFGLSLCFPTGIYDKFCHDVAIREWEQQQGHDRRRNGRHCGEGRCHDDIQQYQWHLGNQWSHRQWVKWTSTYLSLTVVVVWKCSAGCRFHLYLSNTLDILTFRFS